MLTPLHISGVKNGIEDIPLRLFGGTPGKHSVSNIHFRECVELIPYFNEDYDSIDDHTFHSHDRSIVTEDKAISHVGSSTIMNN